MTTISVQFKGETCSLAVREDATVGQLQAQIESRFNVQPDAQRLFQKRRRVDCSDVTRLLTDVCDCTSSLLLMAGASAAQIEDMKTTQDAVEKEMKIRESRRVVNIGKKNEAFAAQEAASTTYRFHRIEPLKQFADVDKAREILEKLANDRGILAAMAKHKWSVGILAEMPPDGKVGVDPVCVLGLNQNKGQKILLRLRTDDLLGFRKFLSIKKVLYHELAHNVHSEHDSKFYQLMRLIEKECNELDWTRSHGAAVGGAQAMVDGENFSESRSGVGHRLGGGSAGTSRLLNETILASIPLPQPELRKQPAVPTQSEPTVSEKPSISVSASENVTMEDTEAHESDPSSHEPVLPHTPQPKVEQLEKTVDEEVATFAMSDRERRIHDAVRHLQVHYNGETIAKAVSLLHKIISNIITHPADAKFRSIRKANRLFDGQVAKFPECLEFLLALGFEDQSDKLVLVREDPALLWIGRSTLEVLLSAAA
ncbi:TBC1 domain, member 5 [Phytophthora boehmeriae]|uniref:TBC1 domain, member 5 n=1 Tax=Phytophthora boehmeriae TaxID=109152 RepID=A0A8T1WVU4_9STRA|nr:TBC1 domain, member 5 [Phytophthora boehmeriae]